MRTSIEICGPWLFTGLLRQRNFGCPLDFKGNGNYSNTEAHLYPWLRSVITDRSNNPDREFMNLIAWRSEVANRIGHAPQFVYGALSMDVFQSSIVAIDYLRKNSATDTGSTEQPVSRDETEDVLIPRWDKESGQLYLGKTVVRRFEPRAKNVIKILDAFEAKGWPPRIKDPLVEEISRRDSAGPPPHPRP